VGSDESERLGSPLLPLILGGVLLVLLTAMWLLTTVRKPRPADGRQPGAKTSLWQRATSPPAIPALPEATSRPPARAGGG
jgi:hypothetical protein